MSGGSERECSLSRFLFRPNVCEHQEAVLRWMQPALGIQSVHARVLPCLADDVRVHERKAPWLHLLCVAKHDDLLAAIYDRCDRGQVNLRSLVNDDDVEDPGLAGNIRATSSGAKIQTGKSLWSIRARCESAFSRSNREKFFAAVWLR